jgi:hypothetical protein
MDLEDQGHKKAEMFCMACIQGLYQLKKPSKKETLQG